MNSDDTTTKPTAEREALRALVLNESFGELGNNYLGAEIDEAGALIVSGEASGPMCEAMSGELASDTWLTLRARWKDELLLRLLADRFVNARELNDYLDSHAIPSERRTA